MHCLPNEHPRKSFLAMAQHSSQWVWYARAFMSFVELSLASSCKDMWSKEFISFPNIFQVSQAFCGLLKLYIREHAQEDKLNENE